jgi:hypothetical protein
MEGGAPVTSVGGTMSRYLILNFVLFLLLALPLGANAQLVFVDPELTVECLDSMFWVDICVDSLVDSIHSYACVMYIDTSKVWPETVITGTIFDSFPNTWPEWDYGVTFPGSLYFGASIMGAGTFVSGPGQLARIVFTCKGEGETPVAFEQWWFLDPSSNLIEVTTKDGWILQVGPGYLFGDANSDGTVNLADVVYIVNYLFVGGPEPVPLWITGDANCDFTVNLADAVYIVNYLFIGGPPPCNPCE